MRQAYLPPMSMVPSGGAPPRLSYTNPQSIDQLPTKPAIHHQQQQPKGQAREIAAPGAPIIQYIRLAATLLPGLPVHNQQQAASQGMRIDPAKCIGTSRRGSRQLAQRFVGPADHCRPQEQPAKPEAVVGCD